MIQIILVIIISGITGGLINFLLYIKEDNPDLQKESRIINFFYHILNGIIASFVVPLFLNTISSNLVSVIFDNPLRAEMLLFVGFCLLASLFSSQFLTGMYSKIVEDQKQMKEKIKEASDTVEDMKKGNDQGIDPKLISEFIKDIPSDNEKEQVQEILRLFTDGKYYSRSIPGFVDVLKKSGNTKFGEVKEETIREIIHKLYDKKIILKVNTKDLSEWWRINPKK